MRKRSNLFAYLLLNILVSAATTLVVLWAWDYTRSLREAPQQVLSPALTQSTAAGVAVSSTVPVEAATALPLPTLPVETAGPTETLPPTDQPLIQILSVVGAGDLEHEVVMLKRIGEGNLSMAGWMLQGEDKNTYTFPEQPELTLYRDGAVQVYTKTGTDTVTEVYWNRSEAAWRSGELVRLLDPEGAERATYRVP
ncbi:MAG: hypothetical protein EHM21_11585 [Chloroflexi bacterium]|nr:MAG: hypothetical protein EHM21_11585 [Chloroflexota bacterium]